MQQPKGHAQQLLCCRLCCMHMQAHCYQGMFRSKPSAMRQSIGIGEVLRPGGRCRSTLVSLGHTSCLPFVFCPISATVTQYQHSRLLPTSRTGERIAAASTELYCSNSELIPSSFAFIRTYVTQYEAFIVIDSGWPCCGELLRQQRD